MRMKTNYIRLSIVHDDDGSATATFRGGHIIVNYMILLIVLFALIPHLYVVVLVVVDVLLEAIVWIPNHPNRLASISCRNP